VSGVRAARLRPFRTREMTPAYLSGRAKRARYAPNLLPLSVSNVADRATRRIAAHSRRVGDPIAARSRIAGIGVGNGNRDPRTTQQQARCEHANTCSEAQVGRNHVMPPKPRNRYQSNVCHILA